MPRIYGLNTVGLMRSGFTEETLSKLKRAYRYLLVSRLNTSRALRRDRARRRLSCPEVQYLVEFIRSSQRGVILRRADAPGGRDGGRRVAVQCGGLTDSAGGLVHPASATQP